MLHDDLLPLLIVTPLFKCMHGLLNHLKLDELFKILLRKVSFVLMTVALMICVTNSANICCLYQLCFLNTSH